ncbi:hypothetical protein [Solimonas marina]|uniref:SH3 domain-containing protein n=1 Tax=Solimonas marina TaxID=2714601 RepID=A0A970B7K7_9GAMM|nr:hypothetical protein [Solimonas marina]NKF21309.1 hypothetical protein [Solimonas marina]
MKGISIIGLAMGAGLTLAACSTPAPKPLEARNVSAPLQLPAGLASRYQPGETVALAAPTTLFLHPLVKGETAAKLPPGALVKLKSRVLNAEGPWWLIEGQNAAGWVSEKTLPTQ